MKYRITHTTSYEYSSPVSICHNLLMLSPRESDRASGLSHRIVIRPTPTSVDRRTDYFGNQIQAISIEEMHDRLSITATSRVTIVPTSASIGEGCAWEEVRDRVGAKTDKEWLSAYPFLFDTQRAIRNEAFEEFALLSFLPKRPVIEAARDLTGRIYRDFDYDTKATSVVTAASESFKIRKGVCQDFAHVAVACLRSIGLPCRYVSGYLRTHPAEGKARLVGADESHAWFSIYCGEGMGWVEFDPTNDTIATEDHIPVAWGREYGDVTPIRGVFLGGGKHRLSVSVDVMPVEE